jgi:hypothetical protein
MIDGPSLFRRRAFIFPSIFGHIHDLTAMAAEKKVLAGTEKALSTKPVSRPLQAAIRAPPENVLWRSTRQ